MNLQLPSPYLQPLRELKLLQVPGDAAADRSELFVTTCCPLESDDDEDDDEKRGAKPKSGIISIGLSSPTVFDSIPDDSMVIAGFFEKHTLASLWGSPEAISLFASNSAI
jgi:hypothetical protein